jgi:hypothetical protein
MLAMQCKQSRNRLAETLVHDPFWMIDMVFHKKPTGSVRAEKRAPSLKSQSPRQSVWGYVTRLLYRPRLEVVVGCTELEIIRTWLAGGMV